jgi:cation:H+ antiporter
MLTASLSVAAGLLLLTFGAERFVHGAAAIAHNIGIAPLIIGLTIVGFATSAPEVLAGALAAWHGKTEIGIGNAIGSNITNITLVLGATALIQPVRATSDTLRREFLFMCAALAAALYVLSDHELSRFDGALLMLGLALTMYLIARIARRAPRGDPLAAEFEQELGPGISTARAVILFMLGLALLLAGAELLVQGAVVIAKELGMSDLVIGLTVVAVGTSLPELAASAMSALKAEPDIAIGNVIGSNMFNMFAVLGVPGLIRPAGFGAEVLQRDFAVMLGGTILLTYMLFARKPNTITRTNGTVLLTCFAGYQLWLLLPAAGAAG